MTHTLVKFETVTLPEYNPLTQSGTRQVLAPRARMADGRVFDRLGTIQAQQGPGAIIYVGTYADDQQHLAERSYYDLLAASGKVGWLVRKRLGLQTFERIWARLDRVDLVQDWQFPTMIRNIRCEFFVTDPVWNGQRWGSYEPAFGAMRALGTAEYQLGYNPINDPVTITGVAATSSILGTIQITGNAPTYGVRIVAAANTSGQTLSGGFYVLSDDLAIEGDPDYHIKYTGDVGFANSAQVVIDTYAKIVTDNVTAGPATKFANFSYGASHNQQDWLVLQPGANIIEIGTNSGNFPTGGVDFDFHFCESWQ